MKNINPLGGVLGLLGWFTASALGHNGLMESGPEGFRELVNLVIAVDFNGLFGGIHDHVAFPTPMEMLVQFGLEPLADGAVQVVS